MEEWEGVEQGEGEVEGERGFVLHLARASTGQDWSGLPRYGGRGQWVGRWAGRWAGLYSQSQGSHIPSATE